MVRHLVRLLALCLVPVVTLAATSVAEAAPTYGDVVGSETISIPSIPQDPVPVAANCTVSGYFVTDAAQGPGAGVTVAIKYSYKCATSYNVDSLYVQFVARGSGCEFRGATVQVDGAPTGSGTLASTSGEVDPSGCVIDELCADYGLQTHSNPWTETPGSTCAGAGSWPLGTPEESDVDEDECFAATIKVTAENVLGYHWNSNDPSRPVWFWTIDYRFTITPKQGYTTQQAWWPYAVYDASPRMDGGSGASTYTDAGVTGSIISLRYFPAAQAAQEKTPAEFVMRVRYSTRSSSGSPGAPDAVQNIPQHRGVGIYWTDPQAAGTGYVTGMPSGAVPSGDPTLSGPRMGIHAPVACAFYFGEKIAFDLPGDDDEPGGPLPLPTDPPEEPPADDPCLTGTEPGCIPEDPEPGGDSCSFSFTDPSTWAGGGICLLVKLITGLLDVAGKMLGVLEDLLGAIGDLLSGILGAIKDALEWAFVPDQQVMRDAVEDALHEWDDTGPLQLVDAAEGVAASLDVPSPSGCAGPELSFSNPLGGGGVTLNPLNACGPAVSTVATVVRAFLTVSVYVGAFLLALRVVGASMGVQLSLGRGET